MTRFKHLLSAAALAAAALFVPQAVWAQGTCPMGQAAPTQLAVTAYTITSSDECAFYIFTSSQPITVTVPAPSALPIHFSVTLMTIGGPLTVSPTSGNINNQSTSQTIGIYTPLTLQGDGTQYWLFLTSMTPQNGQYTNYGDTQSIMPGQQVDNSPVLILGNGVLKFSNQASFLRGQSPPWLGSTVCAGAPFGGQQPGSSWLMIFDNFGIRRYIPTC